MAPPPPPPPPALCLPFGGGKKKAARRLEDSNTLFSEKEFYHHRHHYDDSSNYSPSYSSRTGSYPSGRSRSLPRSGSYHDDLPNEHGNANKERSGSKDSMDGDQYSPTATITSKGGDPEFERDPPASLAFKTDSDSYAHLPSARTSSPPPPQPRKLGFGFGWMLRKQREKDLKGKPGKKEMKEKGMLVRNNSLPVGVGSGIYPSSNDFENNPYGEDGMNSARTSQFSLVSPGIGGIERNGPPVRPRGALTPIPDVDEPPLTRSSSSRSQPPAVPPKRSNTQKSNVTQKSGMSKRSAGAASGTVDTAGGAEGANLSRYNSNASSARRRPGPRPTDSQSTLVGSAFDRKVGFYDEPPKRVNTSERLTKLRALMEKEKLDYYIVPSEDAHGSEYVADCDKRQEFISGFTGSAGTAIITKSSAYLVTDSRYWLQAEDQLDNNWSLVRAPSPISEQGPRDWESFLIQRILQSARNAYAAQARQVEEEQGGLPQLPLVRIGIDARMISYLKASALNTSVQRLSLPSTSKGGGVTVNAKLVFPSQNLVDLVWRDKPLRSREKVFIRDKSFSGEDSRDKIRKIRRWIDESEPARPAYARPLGRSSSSGSGSGSNGSKSGNVVPESQKNVATLMSGLSNIAWTLNLRGSDIPFNPVFISYLFISRDTAVLFIEKEKVESRGSSSSSFEVGKAGSSNSNGSGEAKKPSAVQKYLNLLGVTVMEYNDLWSFLRRAPWGAGRVLIDPQTSYAISLLLTHFRYTIAPGPSYVESLKAIKNDIEIEGLKRAYRRDGAIWVRWVAWLEDKFAKGYEITEWEAGNRLSEMRRKYGVEGNDQMFMGLAYEPISATGKNAALPHYVPLKSEAKMIEMSTPYLNDSGAQYMDGTIDTTRTVHFGSGVDRPTLEMCEAYTRVLQGHIAIDSAVFPIGTSGRQLDVLARNALWKDGLNYLHGTGHGFGSFLNVHEGPHSFSSDVALVPGHVITNEPGFYNDGKWGIRIESALLVKKVDTKYSFQGDVWLGFERLTLVPIQTKMVKEGMLTKEEATWLKEHNKRCYIELEPLLRDDKRALKWLKREAERGIGLAGPVSVPIPGVNQAGIHIEWD